MAGRMRDYINICDGLDCSNDPLCCSLSVHGRAFNSDLHACSLMQRKEVGAVTCRVQVRGVPE